LQVVDADDSGVWSEVMKNSRHYQSMDVHHFSAFKSATAE